MGGAIAKKSLDRVETSFRVSASTGRRVLLSSGTPLTLPGMTSTKEHSDQSKVTFTMICIPPFSSRPSVGLTLAW